MLRRSVVCLLVVACDGEDAVLTSAQESGVAGDTSPSIVGTCGPHGIGCAGDAVCCPDDPATVGGALPRYFIGTVDAAHNVPIVVGDSTRAR